MTEPAFLCDEMLGKLARELRVLGLDAAYAHGSDDDEILQRARDEGRLLLTRDRRLADRAGDQALLVGSLDPDDQLVQVLRDLALTPQAEAFLSRCLACNEPLEEDPDPALPPRVPDQPALRCPTCGRTYWWGTHAQDMAQRLGGHVQGTVGPPEAERNDEEGAPR